MWVKSLVAVLALECACTDANLVDASIGPDATESTDAAIAAHLDAPALIDARRPDAPADAPEYAPRYSSDRTYSPITAAVARQLRTIALKNGDTLRDDVFMKVGDSITESPNFLSCFGGTDFDLGSHGELKPALDHFRGGQAGTTNPFARQSLAAMADWPASAALAGSPSPLEQEQDAVTPRYAVVMFGTHDAAGRSIYAYAADMMTLVDQLTEVGVIPILSSIPPNLVNAMANAQTPRFNAVTRGIAQARRLPYMDFWKELQPLPGKGLDGGFQPNSLADGACRLTSEGLKFGYNVRNLLALSSLARARAVVEGDAPPDPEPNGPAVIGEGSSAKPFIVHGFPFTDLRDTSASPNSNFDRYTGCNATQDESGPEYVYQIQVAERLTMHAFALVRSPVDIDLHLLQGAAAADCILRNDKELTATLEPGRDYTLVLDSYVPANTGAPRSGEYLLVLLVE